MTDETPDAPIAGGTIARLRGSRIVFESALIVLSVLLGLALNDWQDRRRERELTEAALTNFRREIATNLATVRRVQPRHRLLATKFDSASHVPRAGENAFMAFAAVVPNEGVGTEPLSDVAWETAVSTGALRLMNYDQASAVSEVYLVQRTALGETLHLLSDRFLSPQNFDPASRATMLQTHRMLLSELAGQETYLIGLYEKTLTRLGPAR